MMTAEENDVTEVYLIKRMIKRVLQTDCCIDLPFFRLGNCCFYLNDDIRSGDYFELCANCKFHFLNFVSFSFHKITQQCL